LEEMAMRKPRLLEEMTMDVSQIDVSLPVVPRPQSRKEEIANSVSHGIGFIAALVATPFLISHAMQRGVTDFVVGASLFATSMVLLYLTSTLYHAVPIGRTKRILQIIEHSAIFLLIAGTYTPFTLGVLRGTLGWTILGLVWGLAVVGIVLKALNRLLHPIISTGLYLLMGWLLLIGIHPLVTRLPLEGLFWLGGGGVAYTTGVAFFAAESRIKYGHFIWHLFVMVGTACHYCAVLWYSV
jgi:hemolysin III